MTDHDGGRRLREARRKAGLSAMRLAAAAGISQAAVYQIEHGDIRSPTVEVRLALAGVLGCKASDIWPEMAA